MSQNDDQHLKYYARKMLMCGATCPKMMTNIQSNVHEQKFMWAVTCPDVVTDMLRTMQDMMFM